MKPYAWLVGMLLLAGCTERAPSTASPDPASSGDIFPDDYVLTNADLPGWLKIGHQDETPQPPYASAARTARLGFGEGSPHPDTWDWLTFSEYESPERAWEAIQHAYKQDEGASCEYDVDFDGSGRNRDNSNVGEFTSQYATNEAGKHTYLAGRVVVMAIGFGSDEDRRAIVDKLIVKNPEYGRVCPGMNPHGTSSPALDAAPQMGWADDEASDMITVTQAPTNLQWSDFSICAGAAQIESEFNADATSSGGCTLASDFQKMTQCEAQLVTPGTVVSGGDTFSFCTTTAGGVYDVKVEVRHDPSNSISHVFAFSTIAVCK